MAASNSESMTQKQKVYAYKLIKFVDESDGNADTDFVPAAWVHYDEKLEDICTRFMPPPYNTKNCAVLHTMIKTRISPPDSWPKYRIEIRGEAETHADAVKKVEKLRQEEYAFSTDCEENAKQKSSAAKKLYLKPKQTDPVEMERLMDVTPLPDSDDDATVVTGEHYSSSSSSVTETSNSKIKRKRQGRISSDGAGDRESDECSSSSRDGLRSQPDTTERTSTLQSTTPTGKKTLKTKQGMVAGVDKTLSHLLKASESSAKTVPGTGIFVQPEERFDKSPSGFRDGFKRQQSHTAESTLTLQSNTPKRKRNLKTKQGAVTGVDKTSESSAETVSGTSKEVIKPSTQLDEDDSKTNIMRYLRSLAIQQTNTTEAVTELKRLVESIEQKLNLCQTGNAVQNQQREIMLAEKLGMTFPLQNDTDFERFDVALKDPTLIELLRKEMLCLMEIKLPLQRNIGNILKKYMARDLLRSYTAVKKTAGKGVLKTTNLYQRIQENITSEYGKNPKLSPISDKKFGDAVGAVINSAKDWEGRRLLRVTKSGSVANEATTKETSDGETAAEETNVSGEAATREIAAKTTNNETATKNSEQI